MIAWIPKGRCETLAKAAAKDVPNRARGHRRIAKKPWKTMEELKQAGSASSPLPLDATIARVALCCSD